MSGFISTVFRSQIRLLKPILTNMNVDKMRAAQDRLGAMGIKSMSCRVSFAKFNMDGFEACFITPNDLSHECRDKIILYLHGGAYVAGNIEYAEGFGSVLASALNICVLCCAYRLAPENPFPAALDDVFCAYEYLIERGYAPQNITLVGESAGGGLLLALTLKLRDMGMPLPGRLVPISPWTDLTMSGESYIKNTRRDPSLSLDSLRICANMYAAGDKTNPYISPLFADLSGFPPSLIFAGSYELLLDDARLVSQKLKDAGSSSELIVEKGMWHAYVLYGVPEAKNALRKIREFIYA